MKNNDMACGVNSFFLGVDFGKIRSQMVVTITNHHVSFGGDFFTVFSLVTYSLLIWFIEGLMFLYGFSVFDFNISNLSAFFVLGIVNLGVLIPSSPGNVGVFQYFTTLALGVFGIGTSQATAYAFTLHLCQYLPITIMGCIFLSQFGFRSFIDLQRSADSDTEAGT